MRLQSLWSLGVFVVLCLLCAPASVTHGQSTETSWHPVDTGARWVYEIAREKRRILNGSPSEKERFSGELMKEILRPLAKFGDGAFEMRETLKGVIAGETGEHEESKRSVLREDSSGYRVLAEEINDTFIGERGLARFDPHLQVLPEEPVEGAKWHVGVARFNGLVVDIQGEIMGFQDIDTPAGKFEKCLKARYTADVGGELNVYGVRLPVESGTNTSTVWYAPDIGRVMSHEETTAKVLLATGAELELQRQLTYSLKGTNLGDTAAAAPVD